MTADMFEGVQGALIDLDGCVYLGDTVVPGSPNAISTLRAKGLKILFLTNNATRTPAQYAKKLSGLGITASEQDVFTSAVAVSAHILGNYGKGRRVFVLGTDALSSALSSAGCVILNEDDAKKAEFVVSALDLGLTYDRLKAAAYAIQGGAQYLATNLDPNLPVEGGYEPGAGAVASALTTATGVSPELIGKPSRRIVDYALKRLGIAGEDVVVVGDRIETDVRAAKAAGLKSVLVCTGFGRRELGSAAPELLPDAVVDSIADLPSLIGGRVSR